MNVAATIGEQSATRASAGEPKCFPSPVSEGILTVGGHEFIYDDLEGCLVHESPEGGLRVELFMNTFQSDAERLLKALSELGPLMEKTTPLRVIIGSIHPKKNAVGGCDPETGRIAFYADDFGGLVAVGLQAASDKDAQSVNVRQIVAHEMSHVFERNPEIQELLAPVRADLLAHAQSQFQSEAREVIGKCAMAINADYLPPRLKTWEAHCSPERTEIETDQMASEFWAEACASMALGAPADVQGWVPLENLCRFVQVNYENMVANAPTSYANPARTRHRQITPRIDYIADRLPRTASGIER